MTCTSSLSDMDYFFMVSFSVLSFICYTSLIVYIIKKHDMDDFCSRIIFYISINGSIRCLFKSFQLPSTVSSKTLCSLIGFFYGSSNLSTVLWCLYIAVALYQALIQHEYNYFKHHNIWFFFSFIVVPGLFSIPFITMSYGENKGICFFNRSTIGNLYRICLSSIPSFIMVFAGLIIYLKIWRKMKRYDKDCVSNILFVRGYIFIIVTIVCLIPLVIVRMYDFLGNACIPGTIFVIVEAWMALHGILLIFSFMLYNRAKKRFRQKSLGEGATSLIDAQKI